jgi:F-type H+-transporting ATPase subunit delta
MTAGALGRRYASALFDVAVKNGIVDRANRDLAAVHDLVAASPELGHVFQSPGVPPQKKRAVLEAVLAAAGGDLSAEVGRLLGMLAERDRLAILPDVAQAFAEKAAAAAHQVSAQIVTAVPLGDDARSRVTQALGQATGAEVTLTERVDPEIIGGVIARVGSVVFDGSVTRQLEKLRHRLAGENR